MRLVDRGMYFASGLFAMYGSFLYHTGNNAISAGVSMKVVSPIFTEDTSYTTYAIASGVLSIGLIGVNEFVFNRRSKSSEISEKVG